MRKKIIWAFAGLLFLASCQKEVKNSNNQKPELPVPLTGEGGGSIVADKLRSLAQAFLYDARISSTFKKAIYNECLKEKYGDYYIPVKDLIAMNDVLLLWNMTRKQYIQDLVNEIKSLGQNEPVVFIPFLEDKPPTFISNNEYPTGIPDAVIKDEYDTASDRCPGYTLNLSNTLVPKGQNIDEDYAWANDVWVFGQEEGVPSGDTTLRGNPGSNRFNGQAEYGGIIQVTDFRYIEPWINGKPEFQYWVFNAS